MLEGQQLYAYSAMRNFLMFRALAKIAGNQLVQPHERLFCLSGFAGTGKSYLISELVKKLSVRGMVGHCCSFTGRAANNLIMMGIGASTAHSLLMEPILDSEGNLLYFKKRSLDEVKAIAGDYIIYDEASMTSPDLMEILLSLDIPVFFIGDYAQLPSIEGRSIFDMIADGDIDIPFYFMDEIKRQSLDNDIIKLSMRIRDTGNFGRFNGYNEEQVKKMDRRDLNVDFFRQNQDYDVVICGTNRARRRYNTIIRTANGFLNEHPEPGEIVCCTSNSVVEGVQIMNGERFKVLESFPDKEYTRLKLKSMDSRSSKVVSVKVDGEMWTSEQRLEKNLGDRQLHDFVFGYALTCHRVQGSTMKKVLFVDEDVSFFLDQEAFRYTGVTRASEHVTVAL